jgi:ribose/xylose/arabinose/galactoside ABC-type transport system permease subunit
MSVPRVRLGRLAPNANELGLVVAILVVIGLTFVLSGGKASGYYTDPALSATDILRQTSLLGIFALGSAIVIISGGIDLSAGSVIAFSGTICATVMLLLAPEEMKNAESVGMGVVVAGVASSIAAGLLIGSLHAWLITSVGLPPFVATLATLVGLRSLGRALVEHVTAGALGSASTQIQIYDPQFRDLGRQVTNMIVLFLALTALCWLLMSRTVVGRHLYALGGNEQAARLSGIQTDRLKWLAYCISAVLSSIAGILYICDQSVADPQTLGRGYELNAIAAAVVGGCSLQGGAGTIPGTVLGALFLRVVMDGVSKIIKSGADVFEGLIVGGVVVVAVAVTQLRQTGHSGKRLFPGALGLVAAVTLALLAGTLTMLGARQGIAVLVSAITLVVLLGYKFVESRRG